MEFLAGKFFYPQMSERNLFNIPFDVLKTAAASLKEENDVAAPTPSANR